MDVVQFEDAFLPLVAGAPDRFARGHLAVLADAIEDVFAVYARERDLANEPFDAIGWAIGEVLSAHDGNALALYFTNDAGKPLLNEILSLAEGRYRAQIG
jgi:hypothetical protein